MVKPSIERAMLDLYNGNISDFKVWVKRASKLDIINAIEFYSGEYGGRHRIIARLRSALEKNI